MLAIEIFHKLKDIETSSWAVWSENNNDNLEFFLSKKDSLHSRVVFVGLNRSNVVNDLSKVSPLSNFHTKGHVGDKRLKRFIQDANLSNLIGGFMTDISEQIETKSNLVMIEEQNAVNIFTEKIRSIDNSEIRNIICFGDKVFNTFVKALKITKNRIQENSEKKIKEFEIKVDNERWCVYRVWHYSNYGTFIHKAEMELPLQLQYINYKVQVQ